MVAASLLILEWSVIFGDMEHHVWVGTIGGSSAIVWILWLWSSDRNLICVGTCSYGDWFVGSSISASENCNGACSEHLVESYGDCR